jgi:hypothetical protein
MNDDVVVVEGSDEILINEWPSGVLEDDGEY